MRQSFLYSFKSEDDVIDGIWYVHSCSVLESLKFHPYNAGDE